MKFSKIFKFLLPLLKSFTTRAFKFCCWKETCLTLKKKKNENKTKKEGGKKWKFIIKYFAALFFSLEITRKYFNIWNCQKFFEKIGKPNIIYRIGLNFQRSLDSRIPCRLVQKRISLKAFFFFKLTILEPRLRCNKKIIVVLEYNFPTPLTGKLHQSSFANRHIISRQI